MCSISIFIIDNTIQSLCHSKLEKVLLCGFVAHSIKT